MPLLHLLRMYTSSYNNNNNQNITPNNLPFMNNYFYNPNILNKKHRLNYLGNTLMRMKNYENKYEGIQKREDNNFLNTQSLDEDNDSIIPGLHRHERNELNAGAPKMYAQNINELGSTMFRFG